MGEREVKAMFKKLLSVVLLVLALLVPSVTSANPPCTLWTPQFGCVLYAPQLLPSARWCATPDETPGPFQIAIYSNPNFNASTVWAYCEIIDVTPGQTYQVLNLQELNWNGPQFYIQSVRAGSRAAVTFYNYSLLQGQTDSIFFGGNIPSIDWSLTFGSMSASAINYPIFFPPPRRFGF